MESKSAVRSLGALAQESRLAIFRLLVTTGPDGFCVGEIGSELKLAPATLSFHLKELSNAGLVRSRQEGRFIHYAPNFEAMNALIGYLSDNCCGGKPCAVSCAPDVTTAPKRKPARSLSKH